MKFEIGQQATIIVSGESPPQGRTRMKFEIGQQATIIVSGESGRITARAEYEHDQARYFLEYKAADGRETDGWWPESALTA